jgi:hypothetical protein
MLPNKLQPLCNRDAGVSGVARPPTTYSHLPIPTEGTMPQRSGLARAGIGPCVRLYCNHDLTTLRRNDGRAARAKQLGAWNADIIRSLAR